MIEQIINIPLQSKIAAQYGVRPSRTAEQTAGPPYHTKETLTKWDFDVVNTSADHVVESPSRSDNHALCFLSVLLQLLSTVFNLPGDTVSQWCCTSGNSTGKFELQNIADLVAR